MSAARRAWTSWSGRDWARHRTRVACAQLPIPIPDCGSFGAWLVPQVERLEDLAGSITKRTLICGEGVAQHGEYLGQVLGRTGVIISSYTSASRLWALAALAMERLNRGPVDAVDSLERRCRRG